MWQGCFSFIVISQLRRPIELKFSQVCYVMHMLRYTGEDWSLTILPIVSVSLKPLDTFGTEQIHRFNGERLLLKYYSMKCFTCWEIIKAITVLDIENYGFILNTSHDTAKRARKTRVRFPLIYSRLRWRIEPKFHRFLFVISVKVVIHEVCALDKTVYRKRPMALRSDINC